jgi:hypothetical protein
MAKAREEHEEQVERTNPVLVFAKLIGLLALVLAVVGLIAFILRSGGAFDPGPRERLTKGLPVLRPGMEPERVKRLVGPPRENSAKEFVQLLARSGIEHSRIRLAESPHFQSGAVNWEPPANQTYRFRTDEQGPQTQGHLLIRESALKFDKDGKWTFDLGDLVTLDGKHLGVDPKKGPTPPPKPRDAAKGPILPKGPESVKITTPSKRIDFWLYYFRAIQRPKTDDGPIQFLVLLRFEDSALTSVLRCDVDLRGLPKPDGGTFEK